MKTNIHTLGILLIASSVTLFSCQKEELRPVNFEEKSQSVHRIPPKEISKWKITSFIVKGKYESNETSKFENWYFQFYDNGLVVATKKDQKVTGKWESGPLFEIKYLSLDFGGQEPFLELNSIWNVLKETSEYKYLEDTKGGDGLTKDLLFEKL
ncbi:MAG: hypothetical protein K0S44_2036 [Bacteroidetes bacterium]|jgi:hypothetical protein|nr:hypothetical protein [Bacteroidota bacterium]